MVGSSLKQPRDLLDRTPFQVVLPLFLVRFTLARLDRRSSLDSDGTVRTRMASEALSIPARSPLRRSSIDHNYPLTHS
ncbi:hypothetical protein BJV78DRAFT_591690 [Lactifluus subvellereus]|nr:hypothetical protein BJV78DRAFT_591690 [Lactifluus subvellereus]